MLLRKPVKTQALIFFGTLLLAIRATLQHYLDRAGRTTDLSDFALGIVMGIGIGLMALAVWRISRDRHLV